MRERLRRREQRLVDGQTLDANRAEAFNFGLSKSAVGQRAKMGRTHYLARFLVAFGTLVLLFVAMSVDAINHAWFLMLFGPGMSGNAFTVCVALAIIYVNLIEEIEGR